MFAWSPFPFIRYSLALIGGVLLYGQFPLFPHASFAFWALLSLFFIIATIHFISDSEMLRFVCGFFGILTLASLGFYITSLRIIHDQPFHYSHFDHVQAFQGTVVSDFSERKDYYRYDLSVSALLQDSIATPVQGKLFLYVRKEAMDTVYRYGDRLSVKASYFPVNPPGNPEEFDYRSYLRKQGIYSHAFASTADIQLMVNEPPNEVMAYAFAVRSRVKAIIGEVIPEEREQAILLALLVGIKDRIDNETKAAYSSAGAMHVLAVSGLHVGILYILINALLGFLKKNSVGKVGFIFIATMLIWTYALVTGFSPSVLRASVMFSVILISQTVGKHSNIYNSLGVAAFILLLYDPYLIYSVGFQLSFAAVFGIVFLQPRLVCLLAPSGMITRYLWEITCVSIAAQLATFPLTVFYFHQFPTYFLVSNLIVIPAAALILLGGIAAIIGGLISSMIGQWLGWVVFAIIWFVNEAVSLLTLLPLPIVDWLYFDFYDTLFIYLIVLALSLAADYYSKQAVYVALFSVLLWFGYLIVDLRENATQQRIIFYDIKDRIAIDLVHGNEAMLLVDKLDSADLEIVGFQVNPFRLANGLPPIEGSYQLMDSSAMVATLDFGRLVAWKHKRLMILDSAIDLSFDDKINMDVVFINTENAIPFDLIDADKVLLGSNLKSYQEARIKIRLEAAQLSLHSLTDQGFFEIKW